MHEGRMNEFVEQVRSQTDLIQTIQSYVPLKRKGKSYWGCCPFHHEKTPSFSVEPGKGFFYCFGCHAGGDVFKFISMIENVTYFEAIKLQAEKLGIALPERQRSQAEIARDQKIADLRKVNELASDFFHNCLTMTSLGLAGKKYFHSRGIDDNTIKEFKLGFAPNAWDKLSTAFQKRGIKQEFLLASGLSKERTNGEGLYDRFRNRIIIPIADERGRIVGFGGRVLDDSTPKYLNTAETILFNKRKILFGLNRSYRAIATAGYTIVVEGYMDAIAVFGAGIKNVVATLGTAFTIDHCKKLLQHAPEIYFCYDSDDAGQKATLRALSIIMGTGARVKVIVVPDGKDPDEYIRKHGAEAFKALVKKALPLVEYRLQYVLKHNDYTTLEGKVRVIQDMLPVLAHIKEPVVRSEYKKKLSQILLLDEGVINDELRRVRGQPVTVDNTFGSKAPVRQVVNRPDNALLKAGRIVIRLIWQDLAVLQHVKSILPLSGISSSVQREIMEFLQTLSDQGQAPDEVLAAETLSEEANAELSRAMVENLGGREEAEAYADSLRLLRRDYLKQQLLYHTQRADSLLKAGDNAYIAEMQQAKQIKEEMDEG